LATNGTAGRTWSQAAATGIPKIIRLETGRITHPSFPYTRFIHLSANFCTAPATLHYHRARMSGLSASKSASILRKRFHIA
jgi:hypothetical protein